jgi:uncharacterized membrane protein (UPF0127 family)
MLAPMRPLALALAILLLSACGGGSDGGEPPRSVIQTSDGEVAVEVEIADNGDERARGLMGRTELDPDSGMLFVFQNDVSGAFWMKNTLIPLSIAFYAEDGRIVKILDMEPCRGDPCRLYDPGVSYRGALEVNQGAFDRWNVREGDRVRVEG